MVKLDAPSFIAKATKNAPPVNIPAMIIATGIYMPYEGFYLLLLILTVPLAIFSVLFLGRKYVGIIKPEEVLKDIPTYFCSIAEK